MTIKEYFNFRQGRLFWLNLLAMVLVVAGGIYGVLCWLDSYTRHGEAVVVPDVKGMNMPDAEAVFAERNLRCQVADSNYVEALPAGSVLEYTPEAGQKVKEGRIIYLTINTLSVPLHMVPDVADNSSLRQAEARILAAGFKLDSIEYMTGEKDWVYGVKYENRELTIGEKVPTGATLRLLVGDGGEMMNDSIATDSVQVKQESIKQAGAATEEEWF